MKQTKIKKEGNQRDRQVLKTCTLFIAPGQSKTKRGYLTSIDDDEELHDDVVDVSTGARGDDKHLFAPHKLINLLRNNRSYFKRLIIRLLAGKKRQF